MSEAQPKAVAKSTPFINEFIAGCIGGFAQVFIGQPFDIVKVRLQSAPEGTKPSAIGIFKNILKNEGGPLALWKGSLPPLAGVGAAVSIQFGVNENSKKILMAYTGTDKLSLPQLCFCGMLAGLANCIVTIPAEHIRIRMQTQSSTNPLYKGSIDCAKQIYRKYGLKGIYQGTYATLAREGVAYGVYFSAYAWIMQQILKPGQARQDLSLGWVAFSGAMSGMLLWCGSYPLDVIKTKIQTDSFENHQYKGIIDCASKTFKSSGISGFFKGFGPCIARSLPTNAGTFVVYEIIYRALNKNHY